MKYEYSVVVESEITDLEFAVGEAAKNGYRCTGGIAVVDWGDDNKGYYQAMVKESDDVVNELCAACGNDLALSKSVQAQDGKWVHYETGCYAAYAAKLDVSQPPKPRVRRGKEEED